MMPVIVETEQVEKFLIKEARLIDQDRLSEWLDLFTEEAIYWVPSNRDDIDPKRHVSIIYDDRTRLEERVGRLQSGLAYGQEPKSRVCHLITNVFVESNSNDEEAIVHSNFLIVELRRGIQTVYAGNCVHHLIASAEDFKIKSKKVNLLNNNEYLGNLSFIL